MAQMRKNTGREAFMSSVGQSLCFLVNWSLMATMPIWCGTFCAVLILWEAKDGSTELRNKLKGGKWLWE